MPRPGGNRDHVVEPSAVGLVSPRSAGRGTAEEIHAESSRTAEQSPTSLFWSKTEVHSTISVPRVVPNFDSISDLGIGHSVRNWAYWTAIGH